MGAGGGGKCEGRAECARLGRRALQGTQMRRGRLGKSSQTLMPQKWLPARMQACLILCTKSKQNLRPTGAGLPRLLTCRVYWLTRRRKKRPWRRLKLLRCPSSLIASNNRSRLPVHVTKRMIKYAYVAEAAHSSD